LPRFDLAIIGGGINGVGIARDAAGRGLSVLLVERDDLGAHTSSASSRLVHGGLRYLEQYRLRLVAESLAEREVLLANAPHLIRPLRFVVPHAPHLRPAWMMRLGLLLYDHLGGRSSVPRSGSIRLDAPPWNTIVKPGFTRGFEYHDAQVDDARLVIANARSAADLGADIRTRTACAEAVRLPDHWRLDLDDQRSGARTTVEARIVVNAAGPWAERVMRGILGIDAPGRLRLVKGSHLVVRRLYEPDCAFLLQNEDRRVVFLLPFPFAYREGLSVIGTTDVPVDSPDEKPVASPDETAYLLDCASRFLRQPVQRSVIVDSWSGVRALYDDGQASASEVTRDYRLLEHGDGAPALSLFGGKITTYRAVAEHVMRRIARWLPGLRGAWTATSPLPGGDFRGLTRDLLATSVQADHPGLPQVLVAALVARHGTLASRVLEGVRSTHDLGVHFGATLYEREVRWMLEQEWAATADDILWRRTKEGHLLAPAQVARLEAWLASAHG